MNDQRFKELLNLYLDHRLDGTEAAEFEQALRVDASRRKMLRDYMLIQGGCSELFTRAASRAPSSAALCRSLRTVEARITRANSADADTWSWRGWSAGFGVAGLGLAACATILIVVRGGGPTRPAPSVAAANTGVAPAVVSVAAVQNTPAPVMVAAAAVEVASGEVISERQRARNLTLAALGLTMDEPVANRNSQHWADAREAYELANLSPSARSWIRATAASEGGWSQSQTSALTMQTGGGGYAWNSSSSGGYQVESAAYRFER